MAKPLLLLILTVTTLVIAASAASVTIYNPATLPVNIAIPAAGDHPRDGGDYGDDVVKVSTTMKTTVNLSAPEQDVRITSTTGEEHEVEVHVRDGDVLVVIPDAGGDGGLLGFKIDILWHTVSLSVVPPGPR